MKKLSKIIILVIITIVINIRCSDDFREINMPKNKVSSVEPKFFLHTMQKFVFNDYQRNINLYSDFYAQYWANIVSSFGSPRYEYKDDWIGIQWREFYTKTLRKAKAMETMLAGKPNYKNALAIKEILICYWWSRMTDTYGAMPYNKAAEGNAVKYNSQEEIYTDLFKRLDKATKDITVDSKQYQYDGGYDLMYNGDVVKWKKFGNSLRLRLAMRISNVNPTKAKKEVEAAIASGVFENNNDVARVPMWEKGWYDYLDKMAWSWDNIRMSATFSKYMYKQSTLVEEDPRAAKWFAYKKVTGSGKDKKVESLTKEEAGFTQYNGVNNGLNIVPKKLAGETATINLQGGYIDFSGDGGANQMYCPIMFYSEVLFLKSEACMRGWISGDYNKLYKEGVKASMDYVGVDPADANNYINGLHRLTGKNEASLKQLITQKWISNFPNGIEGWADFRRTDYPDLTLPEGGVSGSASVAAGTWVKRIRYPDNEHFQNEKNMPPELNTIAKDRMDIRLWWDTADTKNKSKDSSQLMNSNF